MIKVEKARGFGWRRFVLLIGRRPRRHVYHMSPTEFARLTASCINLGIRMGFLKYRKGKHVHLLAWKQRPSSPAVIGMREFRDLVRQLAAHKP